MLLMTEKDRELAERALTHSDWLALYASCMTSADRAPYQEATKMYQELADKCYLRAQALREGRVMP